jgi:hypothetical protein
VATDQLTYTGALEVVRCWCGIRFGIPSELHAEMYRGRGERQGAYCPLGHEFVFAGKSPAEKRADQLERELESERGRSARLLAELDQETAALLSERNRNRALKGHLTRMRNRIAAGVCPVPGCRRSGFSRVRAHLAAKHPEWLAEHLHDLDA